jgi:hypothetical protein
VITLIIIFQHLISYDHSGESTLSLRTRTMSCTPTSIRLIDLGDCCSSTGSESTLNLARRRIALELTPRASSYSSVPSHSLACSPPPGWSLLYPLAYYAFPLLSRDWLLSQRGQSESEFQLEIVELAQAGATSESLAEREKLHR